MQRRFASPAAFRASVESRLRAHARSAGVPVVVVRRQAALERLLARLMKAAPDRWALKGGLALETRLGERARVSMDMDLDHAGEADLAREDLSEALAMDAEDHFGFTIIEGRQFSEGGINLAVRYMVECAVAGAPFERLQVDVTLQPPEVWETERALRPGLLAALGLGPIEVTLVPLERQVAEKVHALTRTYGSGKASTRVRDLVDLMLIRAFERPVAHRLDEEIQRTFAARGTHETPSRVPSPPREWALPYREEATRLSITTDLDEAHQMAAAWLDPVLSGVARGQWDPERGEWSGDDTQRGD